MRTVTIETGDNQQKLSTLFIDQRGALVRMLSRVVGCARTPTGWWT